MSNKKLEYPQNYLFISSKCVGTYFENNIFINSANQRQSLLCTDDENVVFEVRIW